MAEVTVSELAETVGASVERLLTQMRDAGLPQKTGDEKVSDQEKQKLLAHLKSLHGEQAGDPKKITLRRKSVSTLKAGAGRKTVNVEVRKKRTYVKRESGDELLDGTATETPVVSVAQPGGAAHRNLDDAEDKRLAAIEARKKEEEAARLAADELSLIHI